MAYRVELSERAESDLHRIFLFIDAAESRAAAKWFNGLQQLISDLSALPYRGAASGHDPALRFVLFGNKPHVYRVLYRINEDKRLSTVLTIRHGALTPLM